MSQLRKLATAGGTFAVALGIGFVMQNGDALASRLGGAETGSTDGSTADLVVSQAATEPAAAAPTVNGGGTAMPLAAVASVASPHLGVLVAQATALSAFSPSLGTSDVVPVVVIDDSTDLLLTTAPVAIDPPDDISVPAMPAMPIELAAFETDELMLAPPAAADVAVPDCTISLDGTAGVAATVDLVLAAPCARGETATIHHQGMMFSLRLSDAGLAEATVPALAEAAVFIADITESDGAVAVVTVPDFAMYDRAVLQWQGETGLQLHALEFGAGYADEGHLWNASLGSIDDSLEGSGGFMIRLGTPDGLNAEIYSFPTGYSARAGAVNLNVEAEITEINCGQEIAAQTMQFHPGTDPTALDLVMTLPDCDAVGEFLVLNTMLEDLTLTSR